MANTVTAHFEFGSATLDITATDTGAVTIEMAVPQTTFTLTQAQFDKMLNKLYQAKLFIDNIKF